MNKIGDIIYSVFAMICLTACILYVAYRWIPDESEENKQQVNQELIEIKRVGE